MFTLSTELPFGQPKAPRELHAAFAELREAVTPLAGGRDPETLAEVAWSALHGIATFTRTRRLRPDYHQARLTMLVDQPAQGARLDISQDLRPQEQRKRAAYARPSPIKVKVSSSR